MLLPKRVKYRRVMRGRMKGKATRGRKGICKPHPKQDRTGSDTAARRASG
jgi:hypothetical protein